MFVDIARTKTSKRTIRVTKKQYEGLYKHHGYVIVNDGGNTLPPYEEHSTDVHEEETTSVDDIDTIPVSEMNKSQLMEFARKHNIDTKGAKNVTEARRLIQQAVRKAKM